MRRRGREDEGQAAVELVLVLPLVLLVALAALQVALVARDQVLVVHAAREAARQAAVGEPERAASAGAGATGLDGTRLAIRTERADGGRSVRARATYSSPTDVPLVGALLGEIRLSSQVTMRLER